MKQNIRGNSTEGFIKKLEILIEHGIDVTKITQKDTIQTLAQKSGRIAAKGSSECHCEHEIKRRLQYEYHTYDPGGQLGCRF